jgi:hypothetical protein
VSIRNITDALCAPFEPRDIKFKPQMVKNNKALAIAYVDVRLIEDRLDDVLGVDGWQDDYEILNDGSVTCRLRVKLGDQWVTKMDVGSPSEQPDGGDRLKAAFSDALKRTAVKFGIGRYLYRLPAQWVDYDPAKKQITRPPQLPAFAIPQKKADPPADKARPKKAAPDKALPADGAELHRRLQDKDAKLAAEKLCARGALIAHVTQAGVKAGYPTDLTEWGTPAIAFAVEAVKDFESSIRHAPANPQE